MAEHPDDYEKVREWIEVEANAVVGQPTQHAPVVKQATPPPGKRYYRGAIFPYGAGTPLKIVVRTNEHEAIVAALTASGWEAIVTDPGTTGAPRVWVTVPHARVAKKQLTQLNDLLAAWGTW